MSRILRYVINKSYTICNAVRGMKLGSGAMVHFNSDIRCRRKIRIGDRSILYKKLCIYIGKKGSFSIGSDSHIAPYAYFLVENQNISIGDDVAIGLYSAFFCASVTPEYRETPYHKILTHGDIKIGNNVIIAAHCIILPGTEIEDNVFVAANTVVKGKLKSGWLYAGSPCKPVKKLDEDD